MNGRSAARTEVVAGLAGLALAAVPALRPLPPKWELECFQTINQLSDRLYRPIWCVMQLGALGAAPATAAAALALGHEREARRLLGAGTAAWLAAKVVKVAVGRGRPHAHVADVRLLGPSASGRGFPSGHAGVATALAGAAAMSTGSRVRPLLVGTATIVGVSRIYVGAHLPLDVVGGCALGVTIHGALSLWERRRAESPAMATPQGPVESF